MKSPTENPLDPLGNLGPAIKPAAKPAPAPVPVAPGVVRNSSGQLETQIAPPAPVWHPLPTVVIEDGQAEDWEGLCLDDDYSRRLLGAI